MARELPYFRFTVQEWQNGDISIESYELKGLFIDICGFYWMRDCSIDIAMLEKRFRDAKELLEQLISSDIIKLSEEGGINIEFLDEQFDLLSEKRNKRVQAGKKGGLAKSSNAKAMLEQSSSYKDKDKENNNNKAFVADVNVDEKQYRKYLYDVIFTKPISRDKLFLKHRIDIYLKNDLWADFVDNSIIHVSRIEDEKHAWNTFKLFLKENEKKYQERRQSEFKGFG